MKENNIDAQPCFWGYCLPYAWWNSSYAEKYPIFGYCPHCSIDEQDFFMLNNATTQGFLIDSSLELAFGDILLNSSYRIVAYLYLNNETDYALVNEFENAQIGMDVDQGNSSDYSTPETTLYSWYHLNYTDDASIYGNTLSINGDPAKIDGQIGHAHDFDSNDAMFDSTLNLASPINNTIMAWVRGGADVRGTIVTIQKSGGGDWIFLQSLWGNLSLWYNAQSVNDGDLASTTRINDTSWHLVAMTLNYTSETAKNYTLYVDGVSVKVGSISKIWTDTPDRLVIGARRNAADTITDFFDGDIDEVRIYNRTLSDDEIMLLYNTTKPDNITQFGSALVPVAGELYLNGSNKDVYFELGSTANLSVTGEVNNCISLNITGYTNVACGTDQVDYLFDTIAWDDKVNGSTTLNITNDSTIDFGIDREYTNLTFDIYGYEDDAFEYRLGVENPLSAMDYLGNDIYFIGKFGLLKIDSSFYITTLLTSSNLNTPSLSDIFINKSTEDIHIVYSSSSSVIAYRKYDGSTNTWGNVETVFTGTSVTSIDLHVNDSHTPFVAIAHGATGQKCIQVANRSSGSWTNENVTDCDNAAGGTSATITGYQGYPHLCALGKNTIGLQYIFLNSSGWQYVSTGGVDSGENHMCDIDVFDGEVFLAYHKGTNITIDKVSPAGTLLNNGSINASAVDNIVFYITFAKSASQKTVIFTNRTTGGSIPDLRYVISIVNETSIGTWAGKTVYDESISGVETNYGYNSFGTYRDGNFWLLLTIGSAYNPPGINAETELFSQTQTTYPRNITIDVNNNGTFDLWYPGTLQARTFYLNRSSEGNLTINLTYTTPGTQTFGITIPANVTIELANLTLHGYGNRNYLEILKDFNNHTTSSNTRVFGYRRGTGIYPCTGNPQYDFSQYSNTNYQNIWLNDGSYAEVDRTDSTRESDCDGYWHFFRYQIPENTSRVNNITIKAKSYGKPRLCTDTIRLAVWDYDANEYDTLDSDSACSWVNLTGTVTDFDKYVSSKWLQYAVYMDTSIVVGGTYYLRTDYTNLTVNMNISFPENITVDVGFDSNIEYTLSQELNSTNSPLTIDANVTETQSHVNATVGNYQELIIAINSESEGIIVITQIDFRYNLTEKNFRGINVTDTDGLVVIGADIWGLLEISNIAKNFKGDIAYNASSNASSHILFVKWSNYSVVDPNDWTDEIIFYSRSNTSANLTPWGQASSVPIYNVTNSVSHNINVGAGLNASLDSCMNLTISNTSSKDNGFQLSSTMKTIYNNLTTNFGVWMWLDTDSCAPGLTTVYPEFDVYCDLCVARW